MNEFDQIVKPSFNTKSAIWKHFGFPADDTGTITDQKKTICRLCRAVVAYSGNTSSLKSHLQRCHAQEHRAIQQQDSDDRPGPSSASVVKTSTQLTISVTLAKSTPFSNESVKDKQLVDATASSVHAWTSPVCFYAHCITQIYTLYPYHGMLGLEVMSVPFLTFIVILS